MDTLTAYRISFGNMPEGTRYAGIDVKALSSGIRDTSRRKSKHVRRKTT